MTIRGLFAETGVMIDPHTAVGLAAAREERVDTPMIDDGPTGGVPIGGIGAGSIGRTCDGDFARWHLRVGSHRFARVGACQF